MKSAAKKYNTAKKKRQSKKNDKVKKVDAKITVLTPYPSRDL
jgi:hypothetical protein